MASTTPASANGSSPDSLFRAIDAYPWASDAEFQAGLQALVGSNSDPAQLERLTLRARCFYYARKNGVNVDFAAYQAWHAENGTSEATLREVMNSTRDTQHPTEGQMRPTDATVQAVTNATSEPPPYPMSFQEIVELISTGAPVPGIQDIPDTLLEGQSTEASKPQRRKPWEKDEAAISQTSQNSST